MNTTLNQEHLSNIKRELFGMIKLSGKLTEPIYEDLAESLDTLNFKLYSLNGYASGLAGIIQEMLDLDDLAFDTGQLYHYKHQLH